MATATGISVDQSIAHSQAYVESILSQLDRLPTLSSVAMRLVRATTADDTSACDLVEIIKGDASLTTAILRALHRADVGVRHEIMDVERAVPLLGFTTVRNVALTVSVFESLPGSDHSPTAVNRRAALWTHNLAVACAAEMLANASSARCLTSCPSTTAARRPPISLLNCRPIPNSSQETVAAFPSVCSTKTQTPMYSLAARVVGGVAWGAASPAAAVLSRLRAASFARASICSGVKYISKASDGHALTHFWQPMQVSSETIGSPLSVIRMAPTLGQTL